MKVLVFGATGMLGHALVIRWSRQFEVHAAIHRGIPVSRGFGYLERTRTHENVEAGDEAAVSRVIGSVRPDVIVNAVGIIKQLPSSGNTIRMLTVNSIFPHRLAEIATPLGIRVITVGTDCVFAGDRGMYTESDRPDATDLYGVSKRLGEIGAPNLTIRTSIIGPERGTAHSLLEWFLSNAGGRVRGFRRAVFSGFPTVVLADILAKVIAERPRLAGLYHVSSDPIDKYSLLCLVRGAYGADIGIDPDDDFVIDRSLDSSRFRDETGFSPATWPEMVETMAADDPRRGQIGRNRK
jgi:dTDP-4-dehydrorhamnose reductase